MTVRGGGKRSRRAKAVDAKRPPALVSVPRAEHQRQLPPPLQQKTGHHVQIKAEPMLADITPDGNLQERCEGEEQTQQQQQQHQRAQAPDEEEAAGAHDFLLILDQPPATWYKDQCGRKATFEMKVKRVVRACASCRDRNFLRVELLYESGRLVENQDILRIVSGLSLNKENESVLGLRIMEVSKNHLNQRFRIRVKLPPCLEDALHNVHGVVSDPICVLSKKNKRPNKSNSKPAVVERQSKKRRVYDPEEEQEDRSNASISPPPAPAKPLNRLRSRPTDYGESEQETAPEMMQQDSEVPFSMHNDRLVWWANAAHSLLQQMQWLLQMTNANGTCRVFQCPSCHRTYERDPVHESECELGMLLQSAPCVEAQSPRREEEAKPTSCQDPSERFASKRIPASFQRSDSSMTLPSSFAAPGKSAVSRLVGPMSSISKIPVEKDSSTMSTLCAELFNTDWKMGPPEGQVAGAQEAIQTATTVDAPAPPAAALAPAPAAAPTEAIEPNDAPSGFPSLSKVLLSFDPSAIERKAAQDHANATDRPGEKEPNDPMTDATSTTTTTAGIGGVKATCDFGTLEAGSLGLSEMSCINLNNLSLGLSQVLPSGGGGGGGAGGSTLHHALLNATSNAKSKKKSASAIFSKKEMFSAQEISPPSQLSSLSRIQLSELLRSSKLQEE